MEKQDSSIQQTSDIEVGDDFPHESELPLTVFAKHNVRPDKLDVFESWCREISALCRGFEGYIGKEVIRPTCLENDEYISIFRFKDFTTLQAWMTSPERLGMLDRIPEFSYEQSQIYSYHSLEHWFPLDNDTPKEKGGGPPPMYKMWLVTVAVIYSQTLWVPKVIAIIAPKLDPDLLNFLAVVVIVTLAIYIIFPIVTRLLAFWLVPGANYVENLLELVPNAFKTSPEKGEKKKGTISTDREETIELEPRV